MTTAPQNASVEPPFTELVAGIATSAGELAAAHAAHFRAEVRHKFDRAQVIAGWMATGLALFTLGLAFAFVALVMLLMEYLGWSATAAWATVGVGSALVGIGLGLFGRRQWQEERFAPERTLQALRESMSWITTVPR